VQPIILELFNFYIKGREKHIVDVHDIADIVLAPDIPLFDIFGKAIPRIALLLKYTVNEVLASPK
jgi:hypothetical protein